MKKKLISALLLGCMILGTLSGCGTESASSKTVEAPYYTSEEELPEDAYYIVREVDDETRYYPLLQAENTVETSLEEPTGYDPTRVTWVNADIDELQIPTMYAGDKMIYKSSTMIPEKYSLEKFFDNGYTIGVMGLSRDLSGNYRYYSGNDGNEKTSYTMSTSDATGFDSLEGVESIYLVQVGENRVTSQNVSQSGTVTGLEEGKTYECDIRQGTEKIAATLTANIHYFSSAETYIFGSFTFITPTVAQINVPSYVTTGYYSIGEAGFFRYIVEEGVTDYSNLTSADYNETIYTYDENGAVDGTTFGYVFDENGFIVPVSDENTDSNAEKTKLTYEEYMESLETEDEETENMDTASEAEEAAEEEEGVYSGTFTADEVKQYQTDGANITYMFSASNIETVEVLNFSYESKEENAVVKDGVYELKYTESNEFDGYKIVSLTEETDEVEE